MIIDRILNNAQWNLWSDQHRASWHLRWSLVVFSAVVLAFEKFNIFQYRWFTTTTISLRKIVAGTRWCKPSKFFPQFKTVLTSLKALEIKILIYRLKLHFREPRSCSSTSLWTNSMLSGNDLINFMTTFTLGRFESYLFRYFSVARIEMIILPFIFNNLASNNVYWSHSKDCQISLSYLVSQFYFVWLISIFKFCQNREFEHI